MKRSLARMSCNRFCLLGMFSVFLLHNQSGFAQGIAVKLLGDFQEGWEDHWVERTLTQIPTQYQVVREDTDLVLMAESKESATGLWKMLNIHSIEFGRIKWRWKVAKSLTKNKKEREKVGDDYAARICVIFGPHLLSWKTRAIHYVWAGREPVGAVFRNPYAKSVATIVVESGNKHAGKWVSEQRNFLIDYQKIFGKTPQMVSAVAIMVDTDNTLSTTTAWFDDIVIEWWWPEKSPYNLMERFRIDSLKQSQDKHRF